MHRSLKGLTLVLAPVHPAGSQPPAAPRLVSYSCASTVTVVRESTSTKAALAEGAAQRINRQAHPAVLIMLLFIETAEELIVVHPEEHRLLLAVLSHSVWVAE